MSTTATRDLKAVLTDLRKIQDEYEGKAMPKEVGEKFDSLAQEAFAMQQELERKTTIENLDRFSRTIPNPVMPTGNGNGDGQQQKAQPDDVVGYVSIGEAFINSPEYKQLKQMNFPEGTATSAQFDRTSFLSGGNIRGGVVPITRKAFDSHPEIKRLLEQKAVPTVGSLVVRPTRDPELVRAATVEADRLVIRDLLNVSATDSNLIDYITIDSVTRAAIPVAEGAAKPESTMTLGRSTAPVRTLAVWMPATEQQLADIPQLQNTIDVELRYDLERQEELQVVWGRGTGENLLGIMKTTGVVAGRAVGGDTFLDRIRRAATDVRVTGHVEPNGVAIHPYDWEAIQLLKASTTEYIWIVVTEGSGSRIWGLRVVETVNMTDALGTETTKQRVILVGDFKRGATLWDRQQAAVQVGWRNDDFTKNLRTIRAEERLAFGVKRPKAFAFIETIAAVP